GSEHDIADHLLAPDRVGHADGRGFGDLRALHQHAVDLDRRNVDAAADDQLLLAPGEIEVAVGVEIADVAGAHAAAAVGAHAAVAAERAEMVVVPRTDLDVPGLAGRHGAPLGADDDEPVIGERTADATEPARVPRIDRDPRGLAAAVALGDRDAEALL